MNTTGGIETVLTEHLGAQEALTDVIATHTPDLVALAEDGISEGQHWYCVACGVLPPAHNGAAHVAAAVRAHLLSDVVELQAATAIRDRRRLSWESVHEGQCILDARAALAAAVGGDTE